MGETWGISGQTFLALYVTAAVVLVVATAVHRRIVLRGQPMSGYDHVGPQQAAYLNGGPRLAVYSALGGLRRAGAIGVNPDRTLAPTGPMPAGVTPLDQAIYNAAGRRIQAREVDGDQWVATALTDLRERLERAGLALTPQQRRMLRLEAQLLLLLFGLGVLRLWSGIRNDRPVGYLLVALVGVFVCAMLMLRVPYLTRAGRTALNELRRQHAYLAPAQGPAYGTYGAAAAGMGVALFGAASLYALDPAFAAEAEVQRSLASGSSSSGYSGDSGGGGSCSGGSSCGGGGGGCGGGGCGG